MVLDVEIEKGAQVRPVKILPDKFSGHIVVVTGAAQGIGRTTAELFAAQGVTVVLVDIQEDPLPAVAAGIEATGPGTKAGHRACDVASESAVAETVQAPKIGLGMYAASKAAVLGPVRTAAVEAGQGITVKTAMPGLIKTDTAWSKGVQPNGSHPLFDHVIGKQIVKRCGLPADVAHGICFLAGPEASFITGQILDVGGGEMIH